MALFDETTEVLDWKTFNVETSTRREKDFYHALFQKK